jgi:hypothetical protein
MPSPGSYTEIFGGNNVYPSQPSYLLLNPLAASVTLGWPIEQAPAGTTVVADIIDVNPTAGGLTIQLSDATQVSEGYTALFNNIGANSFNVLNFSGGVIATIASGTVWQLYLSDNTTQNGTWRAFQFGVGVSSATAAALAGAGLVAITTTLNEIMTIQAKSANYVAVTADRATAIEWTGGVGTLTLPNNSSIPAGWFVAVKNSGTGVWTASVTGGDTIDGNATLPLNPEQSCWLVFDGTNFITLGLGQQLNSIFDFDQISLAGSSGTVTLTGTQLNRISYRFVGALAGNVTIVVPGTIQQYWIDNETTGAFSLTFESPTPGTTTAVAQGTRNILYCDGTNVVAAVTFGSTGFINGAVAAPSIFFAASPSTGFYSPGANQLAAATSGTQRSLVDSSGHWTFDTPDTSGAGTFTMVVDGPVPTGTALQVNQQTQSATSPALQVFGSGSGASSFMSICAQTAVVGTSDLSIFQIGTSNDASILHRGTNNLNLGTKGLTRAIITSTGELNLQTPDSGITLFINGFSPSAAVIGFSNASNTGTTAPVLTANKPGASTNIQAWIPVQVGGTLCWIPAWAN